MNASRSNFRVVDPPFGPDITAKSWLTEAPMRMLMNNFQPEVAENPNELVVYGVVGRAARTWGDFDLVVATLKRLDEDETLCSCSPASRSACSAPTQTLPGCSSRTRIWCRTGPISTNSTARGSPFTDR